MKILLILGLAASVPIWSLPSMPVKYKIEMKYDAHIDQFLKDTALINKNLCSHLSQLNPHESGHQVKVSNLKKEASVKLSDYTYKYDIISNEYIQLLDMAEDFLTHVEIFQLRQSNDLKANRDRFRRLELIEVEYRASLRRVVQDAAPPFTAIDPHPSFNALNPPPPSYHCGFI